MSYILFHFYSFLLHSFLNYSIVLYYIIFWYPVIAIQSVLSAGCTIYFAFLSMFLIPIHLSSHVPYSSSYSSFLPSSLFLLQLQLLYISIVLACPSTFSSSSPYQSIRSAVSERRGIYWSRSRGGLWRKGDTSGMHQVAIRPSYSQIPHSSPLFLFSIASFLFSALF
jgi:Phosphoribosyl-AMP cyclohydrolase